MVNGNDWAWVDGSDAVSEGNFVWTSGPEAGDAFDSSLSWYNGDPSGSNQANYDNLLIWDGGGDVLYAFDDDFNAFGYVVEFEGSDLLSAGTFAITSGYDSRGEANTLVGGEGNDTLYGSMGNDTLDGGNGDDIVFGDVGDDIIIAGAGNDVLDGGFGDDVLSSTTTSTMTFTPTVADILAENSNVSYNAATGNFYEYVSVGAATMSHSTALSAATANIINGVSSHLATLSDGAEQTFVGGLINGNDWGWIDGSDSATEGSFVWEAGPDAGDALDASLSWYNGDPSNSNTDARDNLLIWDGGGDVLFAFNGNAYGYIAEWEGSDLLAPTDVLVNTSSDTVSLAGGYGADTLYGGAGIDTFIFEAASAYNDVDQIIDFVTGSGGDLLDISDLLTGFVDGVSDISDFVQFTTSGGDTIVSIDANGVTDGQSFTGIAQINDVTGLEEATLYGNGQIIV